MRSPGWSGPTLALLGSAALPLGLLAVGVALDLQAFRGSTRELAGSTLERIPHLDTFWFAWATYRPGSELVGTVG